AATFRRPRRKTRHQPGDPRMTTRNAGVLMHPTSLPGRYGIGDLGDGLIAFLDWARTAGMQIWQLLPLNPPGYGNSPYGCHSSYAGNPLVISPDRLVRDGLLPDEALSGIPKFPDDRVDFDRVVEFKNDLLRQSWEHFSKHAREDHRYAQRRFEEDNKWLDDWTALGKSAVSMGCHARAEISMVDLALSRGTAIRRHRPHRSFPRIRGLLGDSGERANGGSRPLDAGARPRDVRCSSQSPRRIS